MQNVNIDTSKSQEVHNENSKNLVSSLSASSLPARKISRDQVYQDVTNIIVERLSHGEIPWLKSWSNGIPASGYTGRPYRGINVLLLGFQDYSSRYWLTFKQVKELGGYVKAGEGSPIVFWKWHTPQELERLREKYQRDDVPQAYPFPHYVYNIKQCKGLKEFAGDVEEQVHSPIDLAEDIVAGFSNGPKIEFRNDVLAGAGYSIKADLVRIPPLSRFTSPEEYYSTLFHELVHSTGHESRLGRLVQTPRDFFDKKADYSKEELVAELGSAFLCARCGFAERTIENSAAYIQGWLKVLSNDKKFLMEAASQAQKAVDYLLGNEFESKVEGE